MIPKTIHYCWFSNDPFPVEIKLCMDTWKKVLPDYTLRRWTMEDALSLNCTYVNEALKCKKWAFAADVVRLYALYKEGGVYMDSDVFFKKRFDEFIEGQFVTFHECEVDAFQTEKVREDGEEVPYGLQAAFMIGKKGNEFCKSILDSYQNKHFLNDDGTMDMRVAPNIYAEIAEGIGFKYLNRKQELEGEVFVCESKFFAQSKRDVSPYSFGVHRITHSWKNFNDYPFFRRVEKRLKHYFKVCKYYLFQK